MSQGGIDRFQRDTSAGTLSLFDTLIMKPSATWAISAATADPTGDYVVSALGGRPSSATVGSPYEELESTRPEEKTQVSQMTT